MGGMIKTDKELLRINDDKIEYSTNGGSNWNVRSYILSAWGTPQDLVDNKKELLLMTDKQVMYSTNNGQTWNTRSYL